MHRTRKLLVLWLSLLLSLLAVPGVAQVTTQPVEPPSTQPAEQPAFRFALIADPHIEKVETAENFRRFLFTMQDQKVDFLVILGDIVSYMPDLQQQVAEICKASPLKVYALAGNKENNYGKNPEWFRQAFGDSCYAFDHKGWRFVISDSFNPPPAERLEKQLATPDPAMPIVFCVHAPPSSRKGLNQEPYATLAKYPNVKVALTGHMHDRQTGRFGPITYEVFKDCFLRGPQNPGTYYIVAAMPSGRVSFQERSVADLDLHEPPDALPSLAIRLPQDSQVLHNGTIFRGTAADDRAVRKVEYSLDWGPWLPAQGSKEWQFPLDTSRLTDGNHFLRMRAIDSANQPSLRLASTIISTDNHAAPGRIFRLQQGQAGYTGCRDATVRRFNNKPAKDTPNDPTDLQCWVWDKGKDNPGQLSEFNEFYIRFDLSKAAIPVSARIRRVSLTLHSHWQHSIDPEGQLCRYFVGLPQQDWREDVTFTTRPASPGWTGQPEPRPLIAGSWPQLPWWYLDDMPQPLVIDLTPIKETVQRWLAAPASNYGLVFSPATGRNYNVSARGSRSPDARFRPVLEIEIEPVIEDR